ncbi:MAG: hypothetical protein N3E40_02950 [Dehalococcoidia bacterium]|nr:hypothetical protein [Dehalococcoidia bacterium]
MKQELVTGMRQEMRLSLLMEQAQVMEMPEDEFLRLVKEVEQSPLFRRLYEREKVVRRERLPGTDISRRVFELEAGTVTAPGSFDVETLLSTRDDLVNLVRKVGLENFKRYFLYPETDLGPEEISRVCGLSESEIRRLNQLVDDFSVAAEFYHPSALGDQTTRYSKVAAIEPGPEGLTIAYYSPGHARGRYVIDHERLERLKESGAFTSAEVKELSGLVRKLEMINRRRDTLFRILEMVMARQRLYLETGDPRALLPFTQKEVAEKTGLAASSVSRCLAGRSIDTPWGEKALKDFFPHPRQFRRELVAKVVADEGKPLSDEMVRRRLQDTFGVAISRRSVASLRKELKIPSSWKRRRVREV